MDLWDGCDDMAPRCTDCGEAAPAVGLGDPPDWLCLECLNAAWRRLHDRIRLHLAARLN